MRNTPDDYNDTFDTFDDYIWSMACQEFNTVEPTAKQCQEMWEILTDRMENNYDEGECACGNQKLYESDFCKDCI